MDGGMHGAMHVWMEEWMDEMMLSIAVLTTSLLQFAFVTLARFYLQ